MLLLTATLAAPASAQGTTYAALLDLFREWRAFEEPPRVDGIPDYTPATNARRLESLRALRQRLERIDTAGWSIPQRVDRHLVRAEMNGMEYHLTVLQPFARDPAYYASIRTDESDTPAEEGPTIHGTIRLWQYGVWPRTKLETSRPLTADETRRLTAALRTVPTLLRQARINLAAANARDLWVGGGRAFEEQAGALGQLQALVRNGDRDLATAVAEAKRATEDFAQWLRDETPKRTGPSGIGNVDWTPRGWMRRDPLLGFEQHLYLRQPGYGASYVTGGRLMEEAIAERARQLGDRFSMRRFFDEVDAVGLIPVSMIYWELTGDDRMVRELESVAGPLPPR